MKNIMWFVLIAVIGMAAGCSFVDTIEYEVTYTAISSTPCQIEYVDENHKFIMISNVIHFSKTFKMIAYGDYNNYWTNEFAIRAKYCIGEISIKINGEGVIKNINIACCCKEELRYSRIL